MVTRRDFNHLIAAAGLAAATAPGAGAMSPVFAMGLADDETGRLDEPTLAVLMASAQAVTGVQPLRGHYESYYQHQALHRAGHLDCYRQYAKTIQLAASRSDAVSFEALELPARSALIDKIRASSHTGPLFEIPIFQETLAVFESTDAWLQLGYVSWPGSARGLDTYTRPVQGRAL